MQIMQLQFKANYSHLYSRLCSVLFVGTMSCVLVGSLITCMMDWHTPPLHQDSILAFCMHSTKSTYDYRFDCTYIMMCH